VLNSVYAAADQKKATVLVGFDLSAAFDKIIKVKNNKFSSRLHTCKNGRS